MSTPLRVGLAVQDTRDRGKRGTVTEGPTQRGGREMVRVEWEDGGVAWLPARLVAPAGTDRSVEALLAERAFGGHADFVRNYTH